MKIHTLRLTPATDLRMALERYTHDQAIDAAFVLGCVGSLRVARLRFAGGKSMVELAGPLEIVALAGTLSHDGAHLHIALADGAGRVQGGHVLEGCAVHTTAEIVLGEDPEHVFSREQDAATGFRELVIRSK